MKATGFCTVLLCVTAFALSAFSESQIDIKQALRDSKQTAWSIRGEKQEFKVKASPAGKVLGMIPQVGGALATSVDFVVNDHYRVLVREAMGSYDLAGFVRTCLENRLKEFSPLGLREVRPPGDTAGFSNDRDAEEARLKTLRESGVNLLLDLQVKYGIYDEGFDIKVDIEGKLVDLQKKKRLWMGRIPTVGEAFLADVKFENFILKQIPYIHVPKLVAQEDELKRITENNGAVLKREFEKAVEGGISAVLTDMHLADEPAGHYFLGRKAFQNKRYGRAQEQLVRAVELDPSLIDARNDLSVTYDRLGAPDKAIEYAEKILKDAPEYGPAMYNLAWWNAFERNNGAEAKRYLDQAMAKGIPPSKKLQKRIAKLTEGK